MQHAKRWQVGACVQVIYAILALALSLFEVVAHVQTLSFKHD